MRRYETRSTMMTSNRPLEDWGKLVGDVPSAMAILDRFLHHAEAIEITGRSYRLQHAAGGQGVTRSKSTKAPPERRPKKPSRPRLLRNRRPRTALVNGPRIDHDQSSSPGRF
ncbi:MAG: ATP-binding protein [Pirellulales bacterium]